MIIKRKLYSGKGTQAIYKIINPLYKNKIAARRATIKVKKPLEKAGHEIADRYAVSLAIAGPALPIPVVSQVAGATYTFAPSVVKATPVIGPAISRVEKTKIVKATAKPVHKATDWLFKAGSKI